MFKRHKNILILGLGVYIALSFLDVLFPYIILGGVVLLVAGGINWLRGM